MIDGDAHDFIDKLAYEDHYILFDSRKYYLNGCQMRKEDDGKAVSVRLEVYDLSSKTTVFSTVEESASACLVAFAEAKIWAGKSFWQAEKDMTWIDD